MANNLPKKYHKKGRSYYYVDKNKWTKVGNTVHEVYVHAAKGTTFASIDNMSVAIEKYRLEVLPTLSEKTQNSYGYMLEKIDAVFGHMDPRMIEHEHVCQFHEGLSKKAPISANRHVEVLSALYKRLRRWAGCKENPCEGIIYNTEKPDRHYVSHGDLQTAHLCASPRDKLIIEMLYYSGQRLNDVLSIEMSQINDTGIDIDQGKTGMELTIKWSDGLRSVVKRAVAIKDERSETRFSKYLFVTTDGKRLSVNGFQSSWQRLMERCKKKQDFSPFCPRQIRAKARTDGKDKYLLGHQDPDKMARIYFRARRIVEPTA